MNGNIKLLLATVVGTLMLIVGVSVMFSRTTTPEAAPLVFSDTTVLVEGATHAKGATESAKVTIVEFSDFQCPACRASAPLVEQIVTNNPDTVQMYYRHFPLITLHRNAVPAARAAEAAAAQGKFWEMHDALFLTQQEWADVADPRDQFAQMASDIGLDRDQFLASFDSQETEDRVMTDLRLAEDIKLSGTPTFFVNGQEVSVNQLNSKVQEILSQN